MSTFGTSTVMESIPGAFLFCNPFIAALELLLSLLLCHGRRPPDLQLLGLLVIRY